MSSESKVQCIPTFPSQALVGPLVACDLTMYTYILRLPSVLPSISLGQTIFIAAKNEASAIDPSGGFTCCVEFCSEQPFLFRASTND